MKQSEHLRRRKKKTEGKRREKVEQGKRSTRRNTSNHKRKAEK